MPSKSQISEVIAKLLGRLQGEVEAKIEGESLTLFSEFANQRPNSKKLIKIAKSRNNLLKSTNKILKVVRKVDGIPKKLQKAINAAKKLIRLLKRSRTKLATGTRPSFSHFDRGGLFNAKTAGFTNRSADRLAKAVKLLEDLEDDLRSVRSLTKSIRPSLTKVRDILNKINVQVADCATELEENEEQEELQALINEVNPTENLESDLINDIISSGDINYRAANGRDYKLDIIQDNSLETRIPRKVAVAKDRIGVIVLRGEPSFSSDSEILLEELKFRLDNQLA